MLSPSLAFAWLVWRAQRWGFIGITVYLLVAIAASALLPAYCNEQWAKGIVGAACVGLYMVFMYLLVVFSWADLADVVARDSCFAPCFFRLPVRTGPLVVWPMAVGAAVVVLLWLVAAAFILRPWVAVLDNGYIPLWWPALFATAALAWVQALLWSPFGLRWLRVLLFAALVPGLVASAGFSMHTDVSERLLVGVYAALTGVAWMVSYLGVRKGRCGDVPNWETVLAPLRQVAHWWPRNRTPFASAARAQLWFEWRLNGWTLAFMTGLCLPVILLPLYFGQNDVLPTQQTLLSALGVPMLLAGIFGSHGGGNNPGIKGRIGLGPLNATLPMGTADMVAAMLKVAALSTLATWALMAVALPLAVVMTRNFDEVAGWWRQAIERHHPARMGAAIAAVAMLLVVWTWKRQVDKLYFGLTGRPWVATSIALMWFPGAIFLGVTGVWLYRRPDTHETVLAALPRLLGVLLLGRLLVAAWALRRVLRQGLLKPRTVGRWLTGWLVVASLLFLLLAWAIPTEIVPAHYLALGILFAMPMARLAAAPLALAWNRHR
jgi:hypothetical protein